MAWTDSLGAQEARQANLPPDDANNFADPLTRLIGDHFVGIPDNLNQWADALAASRPVWIEANPAADAMAMSDALTALRGLFANLGPDSAANLADSLGALFAELARLSDDGNLWADQIAVTLTSNFLALSANLPADSAANLADSLAAILQLRAAIIDNANNLDDPMVRLIGDHFIGLPDDLNQWADALAFHLSTLVALSANLPADQMANLADALAGFLTLAVRATDDANNFDDPQILLTGNYSVTLEDSAANFADSLSRALQLRAALTDDAANLADSLLALRGLLVRVSDDANNWADAVAKFITAGASIMAELTDSANNWSDSVQGHFKLFASLVDSAANLLDQLAAAASAFVNLTANLPSDSAANLNDALNARRALLAAITDDANNWNDSAAALHRLLANLTADTWANLADSLAVGNAAQIVANLSDAMSNLVDVLAGSRGLLAGLTDSAANAADSIAMRETLGAQLTDAADNLADAIAGFHELFANLDPDSAANLADAIAGSAFSVIFYLYAWTILGPEFVLKELSAEYALREAA